jgi:hypothetical protein
MKLLNIIILSLLVCSCAASHVTRPRKPKNAPEGYKPVGVVKYLNQGYDSVIEDRREDAFAKMSEECGGKYKIISESEKPGDSTAFVSNGSFDSFTEKYWYIRYECI